MEQSSDIIKISNSDYENMIKESLKLGFKPIRVSDKKAQDLCRNGRKFVYVPKSLFKNNALVHSINTGEFGGYHLKKIG